MRTYKLEPNADYSLFTGCILDGKQYLIIFTNDSMIVAEFSEAGEFQSYTVETKEKYIDYREAEKMALDWMERSSMQLSTIEIKKFRIEDYNVGIRDLPLDYEDFLANREASSAKDAESYDNQIEKWAESQDYVFDHGIGDFWINQYGEIIAT